MNGETDPSAPPIRARVARSVAAILLLLPTFHPTAAGAEDEEEWRLIFGGFGFSFETTGTRGHFEDCRLKACDREDLRLGNLDKSLGFRLGAERALLRRGRLELLVGGEGDVYFTELNRSQRTLILYEGFVTGSTALHLGFAIPRITVGIGGLVAHDVDLRGAGFVESALDIPLVHSVGLRLAYRETFRSNLRNSDTSAVFVMGTRPRRRTSRWAFETVAGASIPGTFGGRSRALSASPFWQITLYRLFGRAGQRVGLGFDSTAWESERRRDFLGVPGNERSKEIAAATLTWDFPVVQTQAIVLRIGGGIKRAPWSDDSLLLDDDGKVVIGTEAEFGVLVRTDLAIAINKPLFLLLGLEPVYWPTIGLEETRLRIGLRMGRR
ncbi:MAG: hypothetical protein ACE5GX_11895 [Thermoanaerobaculia bacterium]